MSEKTEVDFIKQIDGYFYYRYDYVYFLYEELGEKDKKIDKAIEKLYLCGETLNPTFQKEMLEILGGKE